MVHYCCCTYGGVVRSYHRRMILRLIILAILLVVLKEYSKIVDFAITTSAARNKNVIKTTTTTTKKQPHQNLKPLLPSSSHPNNVTATVRVVDDIKPKPIPVVHFRTYGTDEYAATKNRIVKEAINTGWFQTVLSQGPDDLPHDFTERYQDILNLRRGGGYWIWKYPVLEQALATMNDGDFLVFADAGCNINKKGEIRFREYIHMLQQSPYDMIGFQMIDQLEYKWTTEKVFEALGVENNNTDIRESGQLVGGILILQKGPHIRKWLDMVNGILDRDPWLFTDKYNDESHKLNPKFKDARHDQSISSVSRKVLGYVNIKDETYPPRQIDKPFWASRIRLFS